MLVVEVLDGKKHDRQIFDCGNTELNVYLQTKASQDVREGYCQVYVVADHTVKTKSCIYGFFSISPYTLEFNQVEGLLSRSRKKYATIPAILLGRLAKEKNQNLLSGSELLQLALREVKSAYEKLGGVFIVTHPKDEHAKDFYMKHGFLELPSDDQTLLLHLKSIV